MLSGDAASCPNIVEFLDFGSVKYLSCERFNLPGMNVSPLLLIETKFPFESI